MKPTEFQKELIDKIIQEIESWKGTNDIASPSHNNLIEEFTSELPVKINTQIRIDEGLNKIFWAISDSKESHDL